MSPQQEGVRTGPKGQRTSGDKCAKGKGSSSCGKGSRDILTAKVEFTHQYIFIIKTWNNHCFYQHDLKLCLSTKSQSKFVVSCTSRDRLDHILPLLLYSLLKFIG